MDTVDQIKEYIRERIAFLNKKYDESDDLDFKVAISNRKMELIDLLELTETKQG